MTVSWLEPFATADLLQLRAQLVKYSPDQPRIPAGGPTGGEFADSAASDGTPSGILPRESEMVTKWVTDYDAMHRMQAKPTGEEAQAFAAAVAKSPPINGTIYRGMQAAAPTLQGNVDYFKEHIGQTMRFPRPVSTSPVLQVAAAYAEPILLKITPQDGAARDITWKLAALGEPRFKEAIMAPGRFRIEAVQVKTVHDSFYEKDRTRQAVVVSLTDVTKGDRQWTSLPAPVAKAEQPTRHRLQGTPDELVFEKRTITRNSGGHRRDARLNPIVARVKEQLVALAAVHANRPTLTVLKAADWDEAAHPREPAGTPEGGEFAGGAGSGRMTMEAYNALPFSDKWELPEDKKPWPAIRQKLNPEQDQLSFLPGILLSSAHANGELTAAEKDALMDYTSSSTGLNSVLRFDRTTPYERPYDPDKPEAIEKYREQAKTLDEVIQAKGITSSEEASVWRGVDGRTFTGLSRGFDKAVGQVIEDKGFLSTLPPYDRNATKNFGSVDLEIKIPPGIPHVEIDGNSEGTEWLFGTGSKLRVDAYYPRDYGRRPTFEVTMLP